VLLIFLHLFINTCSGIEDVLKRISQAVKKCNTFL
jgi:hypothetical protein